MSQPRDFGNWDPFTRRVANDTKPGEFVGSHNILIAAGPPRFTNTVTASEDTLTINQSSFEKYFFPIGIVQQVRFHQPKELGRIWEIGSYRSYFIPGRVPYSITMGKLMYHGPTLMRALYAVRGASVDGKEFDRLVPAGGPGQGTLPPIEDPEVHENPGSNNDFWINAGSDITDFGFGLLFYFRDSRSHDYGAFFCQDCFMDNFSFDIANTPVAIGENVSIQFDRIIPISLLINGAKDTKTSVSRERVSSTV